ncbi:TIGR03668 family PPOX class F420-dependent oxidoreductase [Lipingzhangella sp. LS1_29]|uniref:TIGR03668 family PPOX class F420-dependent oxidoreductase n=1 Tax=Lipingzhangella rawalii TaxID=2055835 RepID=A0ABU2H2X4_9ACTN|nr:TIGR03668 family PPOX class F420-dependent oxidoreductase [Lipingzhangella rawalii]MDS1269648.1 TIGR03668 family PPOX class F420-dependent oxidoreductase [Lipingzhangella rawalii]
MWWSAQQVRDRFADSRVARLATTDANAQPHVVPVTFAVHEDTDTIAIGIDHKPKRTHNLKRLSNIAENPRVSLLVDDYTEDWDQLWWARADGTARVELDGTAWHDALDWLIARYAQYRQQPPVGPMILVTVHRWSGWSAR